MPNLWDMTQAEHPDPASRAGLIKRLREAIQAESYRVDPAAIANAMFLRARTAPCKSAPTIEGNPSLPMALWKSNRSKR